MNKEYEDKYAGTNKIPAGDDPYWGSYTVTEWLYHHKAVWCKLDMLLDDGADVVEASRIINEVFGTGYDDTIGLVTCYIEEMACHDGANSTHAAIMDDLEGQGISATDVVALMSKLESGDYPDDNDNYGWDDESEEERYDGIDNTDTASMDTNSIEEQV
jgi:hypothetical protein